LFVVRGTVSLLLHVDMLYMQYGTWTCNVDKLFICLKASDLLIHSFISFISVKEAVDRPQRPKQ